MSPYVLVLDVVLTTILLVFVYRETGWATTTCLTLVALRFLIEEHRP